MANYVCMYVLYFCNIRIFELIIDPLRFFISSNNNVNNIVCFYFTIVRYKFNLLHLNHLLFNSKEEVLRIPSFSLGICLTSLKMSINFETFTYILIYNNIILFKDNSITFTNLILADYIREHITNIYQKMYIYAMFRIYFFKNVCLIFLLL